MRRRLRGFDGRQERLPDTLDLNVVRTFCLLHIVTVSFEELRCVGSDQLSDQCSERMGMFIVTTWMRPYAAAPSHSSTRRTPFDSSKFLP